MRPYKKRNRNGVSIVFKRFKINDIDAQKKKYMVLSAFIVLMMIVFSIISPTFLSVQTFMNLIMQSASLLIIGIGMTFVIITANTDLSVGSQVALCGVAGAMAVSSFPDNSIVGALVGITATILTGSAVGLFNGFMVGVCGVNSFITTLASMTLARGLTLVICGDARVAVNNTIYNYMAQGKIGVFPGVVILLAAVVILGYILLNHMSFGRRTYAVGGNPTAARIVGINPARHIILVFTLNGLMCGLAAIVTVGRTLSAQPLAGLNLEFEIITAVVLGGTSLMGGIGTITGTLLGAVLMGTISTGLGMVNVPVFFNYLLKGILILLAVYSDISTAEKDKRKLAKTLKAQKRLEKTPLESSDNWAAAMQRVKNDEHKVLELSGISKEFPGVKALENVSLKIKRGTVHALVGENGAGKSTLMKILAGVYMRDEGAILVDGIPVDIKSPMDSQKLGISVIYQELELVPELSVYSNIFLGKEYTGKNGVLFDTKKMKKEAENLLHKFGLDINVNAKTNKFTVGQRQMIEIVKAVGSNSFVIVMDEPTSSITNADKEKLFDTIRELKKQGVAIIYISHRMQEIFEIADEVTVLRDGKHIMTAPLGEVNEADLVKHMVGRELNNIYGRSHLKPGKTVLEVRNLTKKGVFENISFTLHESEVLGFSGLIGAGRSEIMRCIFGLDKYDEGEIFLYGQKVKIKNPKDAARKGIAFVTEDRRGEGIVPLMSVGANITMPILTQLCTAGWIKEKEDEKTAQEYVERLQIKTPSIKQSIGNLSGGNQQKCCIAKWLATHPRIIILDEPTKGIDIGAKEEIHKIVDQLVREKYAVIMISSELPEIIGACDNIIVMYEGKISGEFNADKTVITQELLMTSAAGVN